MSFSKSGKPSLDLKVIYNKWRLLSLGLDLAGLVAFFFALGMGDLTVPLMIVAVVLLWGGVAASREYIKAERGKPFETAAKMSYFISLIIALVLTVLAVITILNG